MCVCVCVCVRVFVCVCVCVPLQCNTLGFLTPKCSVATTRPPHTLYHIVCHGVPVILLLLLACFCDETTVQRERERERERDCVCKVVSRRVYVGFQE